MSTDTLDNLAGIVGKHFIYTYDNGWQYELYVKNAKTIDYRIHGGMVRGRWVKDQQVEVVRLADDVYKIAWTEPTGTSVSLNFMLDQRRTHGTIYFPRWVHEHPERTVCFQNEHLDEMERFRADGPTYPLYVVNEYSTITFTEDAGPDDETVISCSPADLPPGYLDRRN